MRTAQQRLDDISTLTSNTPGDPKANPASIAHAREWITLFQQEVGSDWSEPNVTLDAWGDVCFEWWQGKNHLSIFVGERSAEFLTSFGGCSIADMSDGSADTPQERMALWQWLKGSEDEQP